MGNRHHTCYQPLGAAEASEERLIPVSLGRILRGSAGVKYRCDLPKPDLTGTQTSKIGYPDLPPVGLLKIRPELTGTTRFSLAHRSRAARTAAGTAALMAKKHGRCPPRESARVATSKNRAECRYGPGPRGG